MQGFYWHFLCNRKTLFAIAKNSCEFSLRMLLFIKGGEYMIHLICPNPAIDRTLLLKGFSKEIPNRPIQVNEYPGGKSFNVAYAIQKEENNMDIKVHTILGGFFGEYVKELAEERGISIVETNVETNTRACNIIVDIDDNIIYPIYEKGFELSKTVLESFTDKLIKSIKNNDIIVFSGSFMKGFPKNYISQLKKQLSNKKIDFYIDTTGDYLIDAYKNKPYLIKINDEEIIDLFDTIKLNNVNDYIDLLKNKVDSEIPYFIITLGAKGAVAKLKDEFFHIQVPPIDAKNPVASGDFFLGALVSSVNTHKEPDLKTLQKAIAYSSANCLSWFPEFSIEDANRLFEQVQITKF